jgi:hypothetical protein
VKAQIGPLAFHLPFALAPVPADTRELRGVGGTSALDRIDAVLEVFVVCACRVLLRRVIPERCPLANCPPFELVLVPVDTRELRGADFSVLYRIDAILKVFAVCARRVLLRGVQAQVLLLALRLSFFRKLVPGDALDQRGSIRGGSTALLEYRSKACPLLSLRLGNVPFFVLLSTHELKYGHMGHGGLLNPIDAAMDVTRWW